MLQKVHWPKETGGLSESRLSNIQFCPGKWDEPGKSQNFLDRQFGDLSNESSDAFRQ